MKYESREKFVGLKIENKYITEFAKLNKGIIESKQNNQDILIRKYLFKNIETIKMLINKFFGGNQTVDINFFIII